MHISKIPFEILSCTGSDPEYAVEDITKHGPFATGWQSERGIHRVFKIQLLLHHYKIPTKIDIAIATHPDKFDRLGYISLGDNSKNSYKARELKTIHIDAKCLYVKLTFHRCFVNALNLYNQIGLVAVNVLGSVQNQDEISNTSPVVRGIIERTFVDENTMPEDDLAHFDHDRFIVKAIAQINSTKKEAVEKEDFIHAKQLKSLEQVFSKAAVDVFSLQTKKKHATMLEDYDQAQHHHSEIQQIKGVLNKKLQEAGIILFMDENTVPEVVVKKPVITKPLVIEESTVSRPTSSSGRDATTPGSLTEQEAKEYSLAVQVFSEKTVASVLSPYFNLREAGLRQVTEHVTNSQDNAQDVVKAAFQMILFASNDIREKSNALFTSLFEETISFSEKHQVPHNVMIPLIAQPFPTLLNKTADLNPRIRQKAIDLVVYLAQIYHIGHDSVLPLIIKPMGSKITSIPAKHAKARIELTNQMLNEYGLQDHDHHSPWSSTNIIKFTQPFLSHTHTEVRDVASTLLANIVMLKGPDESTEAPTEPAVQKKASSMNDIRSNPASPRIKKERVQTPIKKKTVAKEKVAKSVPVNPTEELHSRKSTADSDRFQQTCIFCDLEDDTFTEETLDLHYWKECPALTVCEHCRMLVEISEMNQHLTLDCDKADEFITCPKCKMAVDRNEVASHKQGPLCRPQHYPDTIRCALCWQDFKGSLGIKNHFILKPGCPESLRKPLKEKKSGMKQFRFKD